MEWFAQHWGIQIIVGTILGIFIAELIGKIIRWFLNI
jgi:membrane-associated phospholipid phosphatase